MTQYRVIIDPSDTISWQDWIDCATAMCEDLRDLNDPKVDQILGDYEFRKCDYGMGLNIDWPEPKEE